MFSHLNRALTLESTDKSNFHSRKSILYFLQADNNLASVKLSPALNIQLFL